MSARQWIPLFCLAALSACFQPRKAEERGCRRAERLMARAVFKCPKLLQADTATRTVSLVLPGDSLTTTLGFTDPVLDSLAAACAQFAEALAAERDLYQVALRAAHDSLRAAQAVPPPGTSPAVQAAIVRTRLQACTFQPFTYVHDRATVLVRPGPDGLPQLTVHVSELQEQLDCPPCPPQVTQHTTVQHGVAPWYRTYFWCTIGVLVLLIIISVLLVFKNAWIG